MSKKSKYLIRRHFSIYQINLINVNLLLVQFLLNLISQIYRRDFRFACCQIIETCYT